MVSCFEAEWVVTLPCRYLTHLYVVLCHAFHLVLRLCFKAMSLVSIRFSPAGTHSLITTTETASRSHFDLSFFAKMDRYYPTTFMMLVTLSVIFIVNDDSFARKEFVF